MAKSTADKVEAVHQAAKEISDREAAEPIGSKSGGEVAAEIVRHVQG